MLYFAFVSVVFMLLRVANDKFIIMAALRSTCGHYFLPCGFFFYLSIFLFFLA